MANPENEPVIRPASPPPLSSWDGTWTPHSASVRRFAHLTPGASITVVKRAPDGTESTRYPGTVIETSASPPWIEIEAIWDAPIVNAAGLMFEPGDILREFYSPVHPFNSFAVATAGGAHKGWYGNVTYPAFLLPGTDEPTLVWHDLYLDVVVLACGTVHLLDDDELDAAPAPFSEPPMHRAIHAARDDLLAFIQLLSDHA